MSNRSVVIDLTASEADLPSQTRPRNSDAITIENTIITEDIIISDQPSTATRRTERPQRLPDQADDDVVVIRTVRSRTPPVTVSNIFKPVVLTVPTTPKAAAASETKKCPICLDPLSQPSATICGHVFCSSCISAAVKLHQICPICRKKLPRKNGYHTLFF